MNNPCKILVNSIPKSGTHLMMQLVQGIPGMTIAASWIHPEEKLSLIKEGIFAPAHLPYSPSAEEYIRKNNIKIILVTRDLRDNVVSLVHFVMRNQYNHPYNPYLEKGLHSHEDRLMTMIKGAKVDDPLYGGPLIVQNIRGYSIDVMKWLDYEHVCWVKFEDLAGDKKTKHNTLLRIVDHLWNGLQELNLTKEEIVEKMLTNVNPGTSATFRKGSIGDWRNDFTPEHKRVFKEVAGDLLIRLGYEKDYNW
ncbi:sulfotransferase domain-containing protein [Rossellomorea vietnamensis]|uniref:Sulfotransferase domain-containing protein n=1 Tax=Rossellomorea vietnamensis TaxID=218284 RepID=A0A5D4MBM8_9BACI|nr:sulfotransferase domain-containing protein [Rossellomorea vietnamensis]TYR98898.1 sulfotransferase domain-containing protein [Rossellomorea vietnamensis]